VSEIKTLNFKEWFEIGTKLYGDKIINWKFKCVMCKKSQTAKDFMDAGIEWDKVDGYIGFSCIGRVNGKGKPYLSGKNIKKFPHGCDWTLGGLFVVAGLIIMKDGKEYRRFDFADSIATPQKAEDEKESRGAG
jgi:hypothetical protein